MRRVQIDWWLLIGVLAAVAVTAATYFDKPAGTGENVRGLWSSLGSARGFVVGAAVTVLGFLVNNRSINRLEARRYERETQTREAEWQRDDKRALLEVQRRTYTEVLTTLTEAWFIRRIENDEERTRKTAELRARTASLVQQVRFCSDDGAVIGGIIEFGKQVVEITADNNKKTRDAFEAARLTFVQAAREELGFKNHNAKSSAATSADLAPVDGQTSS